MVPKLENIMTKSVLTVEANATVWTAVELMNEHEIGCLVVTDGEMPIGIVTERDMMKRVLVAIKNPMLTLVSEVMSKPLVFGKSDMSIGDAVKLMFERKIKKLPIVENRRLVGLVTLTDIIRSHEMVNWLKKSQLNSAPQRMKKIVDVYVDSTARLRRRCPLITQGAQSINCKGDKCMWWFEDDCVITKLSRRMLTPENVHVIDRDSTDVASSF